MRVRASLFVLFVALSFVRADVKPHALFTDGMVLQQKVECPVWGTAAPGESVQILLHKDGDAKGIALDAKTEQDGVFRARIHAHAAGGPYTLTFKGKNTVAVKDVYFGEVWVASGQSNMQWSINAGETPDKIKAAATNKMIRFFTVPHTPADKPQQNVVASWQVSSPEVAGNFSAVAYHFAVDLQKTLKVPVGIIHSSWGGTICEAWMAKEDIVKNDEIKSLWENYEKNYPTMVKNFPAQEAKYKEDLAKWKVAADKAKKDGVKAPTAPRAPVHPDKSPNRPAVLFNGMIANIQPYAIKGAIWYQGESNASRAYQYRTLFPAMIESWRRVWNMPEMPFYFVQLAPFMAISKEPQDSAWAELREAQNLTALNLKHTGQAVITDAGDEKDIHPKPKQIVGERLALCARALTYNEKIAFSGPIYDSKEIKGNKVVLSFKQVGKGLEAKGGTLTGFTIAGEDRKFYNAEAVIEGDKIVVSSEKVDKPVAVRYGWANYPVVNLFNKDGIPASPFRTDDWPGVTKPK